MNKKQDITSGTRRESSRNENLNPSYSWKKGVSLLALLPLVTLFIFSFTAFQHGTSGFQVDKTQQGLLVSKVLYEINPVQEGDLIVAINGLSYSRILGLLLLPSPQNAEPSVTVLRDKQRFLFTPVFITTTWSLYFSVVWPHILLITLFLSLGSIALFRAPSGQPSFLFFCMLCAFSNTIATTLPSQLGLLQPKVISLSFLSISLSNWFAFGGLTHFIYRFPRERDLFKKRPFLACLFYLIPMSIAVGGALIISGLSVDFFPSLQRLRNLCVPILVVGSFVKHTVDLRYLVSPSAKNQVKLSLFSYWFSFAPYLLLYLLPNLLIDHPLISFRIVLLTAIILPTAHLIALLRYNLLGVDRLISRVTAYFLVILCLTAIYIALLAFLKRWLFGRQIFSEKLFLVFLLTVAIGMNPLINWTQKLIDRFFFRYHPDDNKVLFDISQKLSATLQFPDLISLINDELPQKIKIRWNAVLLIEENRSRLFPKHLRIGSSPWPDSHLIRQFRQGKQAFFCLEQQNNPELDMELSQLSNAGFHLVLPLRGGTTVTGALILGPRMDDRLYRDQDIQMLAILANQIAVAIENSLHYTSLKQSKEQLQSLFAKVVQTKKMAALGEMTATLAHELKNPLGIIRSSAQYLEKEPRPPEINHEILGYIIDEVDGLNNVVTNILGLAKFKKPVLKAINLQKHIPRLCRQWQRSENHNPTVQIECSVASRLPLLYADYQQLRQVLLNLASNSEEATGDHGHIFLSVQQDDDYVLLQFRDDGPGIAQEHAEELFKNFFTTKEDGLGMGLTVSRQIITAHHGTITLHNLPEQGLEIAIRLPFRPLATLGQDNIETGKTDER